MTSHTSKKKEVSWDDRPVSTARRSEGHETTLDIPRPEKMGTTYGTTSCVAFMRFE